MFAAGSTEIGHVDVPKNKEAEERRGSSFVRSAFTDRELELEMLASMPDAEEAPPPLLPPGWEQRLDQRSGKIFYVDHNTCTTQWVDPRSESALRSRSRSRVGSLSRADSEASADDGEDGEDEEAAAGAASDLVALSTGVRLPEAEQHQLTEWFNALDIDGSGGAAAC